MVEQTQSQKNHTSYIKFNFNEFVASVLRDNMGMKILTSEVVEAVGGQKIISWRTLWHLNSMFGSSLSASSAYQRFKK